MHARAYPVYSFLEDIAGKVDFVRSGKGGDFEGVLENSDIVVELGLLPGVLEIGGSELLLQVIAGLSQFCQL